jgi:hypothetical protein
LALGAGTTYRFVFARFLNFRVLTWTEYRQDAEISDALGSPTFKAFWLIQSSGMQHLSPRLS